MQDTIYTIPVTESYENPCECPLCVLEARFENDRVNYYLGPSLMEPENRIATNETGFCGKHFGMMYNTRANRLGLGLIIDTYMNEQVKKLRKLAGTLGRTDGQEDGADSGEEANADPAADEAVPETRTAVKEKKSFFSMFAPAKKGGAKAAEDMCAYWREHEKSCCICADLERTMARYIDVIFHLYFSQKEFRAKFDSGMGYCMRHFEILAESAEKSLSGGKQDTFLTSLVKMQLANLERINGEVNWFTKKFDYRYTQEPWKNSRDALPRAMRKLTGEREIGEGD